MDYKPTERTLWAKGTREKTKVVYENQIVAINPMPPHEQLKDGEQSQVSHPGGQEAYTTVHEQQRRSLSGSVREFRRRFWHLRNRIKTSLKSIGHKRDQSSESQSRTSQLKPTPVAKKISTQSALELFEVEYANLKLREDIINLSSENVNSPLSTPELSELIRKLYKAGSIARPAELLDKHSYIFEDVPPEHRSIFEDILEDRRLRTKKPDVPQRMNSSVIIPERGRILYCAASTADYNSNGYATRTMGLISGLRGRGKDVVVAARPGYPWDARTDRNPAKKKFHTKSTGGVEFAYSFGPSVKSQTLSDYFQSAVDSYLRLIERYRPAHVHAASNHITALPALIAARIAGLSFSYEVRGFWEYALADVLDEPNERRLLATELEDLVLSNADHIFTISDEMRRELISRHYASEDITVLPNGVDTSQFQPLPVVGDLVRKHALDDGKINIGYAGSMVSYEGLDTLVKAAIDLSADRDDFRLVLVGDGPVLPGLKQLVEDSAQQLDVKFLGRVAPSHIPQLVSSFNVTVAARKETEVTKLVSPLKPLESMAAGVPVVASDLPVLRSLINESQAGVLFESENQEDLKRVLNVLLDDPEELARFGRAGRSWALSQRQWNNVASNMVKSIHSIPSMADIEELPLKYVRVGIIADEFTINSFQDVVRLTKIERHNWKRQLESNSVDVIFVESAWSGNDGQWARGVGHYTDEESDDLRMLLARSRELGIPTVFWNKEDPVHFKRFEPNALLFDLVLTTDNRSIPKYQMGRRCASQQFGSMPFFARPDLHHPVSDSTISEPSVLYAGSYYGERYPERSKALLALLEGSVSSGLTIYDRQAKNPESPYKFPDFLTPYVRGGLPYTEMVDAYRNFPVHLNVNSVVNSETMFSRRVVEIGLTGGLVLSSPSTAIDFLFSGMVPSAKTSEDTQALIRMVMDDPVLRNIQGWNVRRAVRRSHTVETRLATIFRRLGLNVCGFGSKKIAVSVDGVVDLESVISLVNQSYRPSIVIIPTPESISKEVESLLQDNDVIVADSIEECSAKVDFVFHWTGEYLDSAVLEDLVLLSCDIDASSVILDNRIPESAAAPLATRVEIQPTNHDGSVLLRTETTGSQRNAVSARRGILIEPESRYDSDPYRAVQPQTEILRQQTVLVAGHDLKFAQDLISEFGALGAKVLIDEWGSHNEHDEERSMDLLSQADIVFCEWGLGNAVWYSEHVDADQRLVIRVHSQELFRAYLSEIKSESVDSLVFVSPHIRDAALHFRNVRRMQSSVIPNLVRKEELCTANYRDRRYAIGLVGVVPQQKGLHRALELLTKLRLRDSRFSLRIKGKLPEDFPWMRSRQHEMSYYEAQYEKIENQTLLKDAVYFDGYNPDDMRDWYQSIGFAISVSDFESFHFTLVDGAMNGALPISLRWPGSDRLYPEAWLVNNIDEMVERIVSLVQDPECMRQQAEKAHNYVDFHFNYEQNLSQLMSVILGD